MLTHYLIFVDVIRKSDINALPEKCGYHIAVEKLNVDTQYISVFETPKKVKIPNCQATF